MQKMICKAKKLSTGEWTCGYLVGTYHEDKHYGIAEMVKYDDRKISVIIEEVDKETICYCSALKDKDGNYIYSGDRIRYVNNCGEEMISETFFNDACFIIAPFNDHYYYLGDIVVRFNPKIIGNIHDK